MKNYRIILISMLIWGSGVSLITGQTVIDIDGNTYKTVTIGTQTWMAENLKTTLYNDGSPIPLVTVETAWTNSSAPAFCWYNNDEAAYKKTFGALYNWYAVDSASNGGKNVCPDGWRLPTHPQWTLLTDYLTKNGFGYAGHAGDIGKSLAATSGWTLSLTAGNIGNDQAGNNRCGFSALPGGFRDFDATFDTNGGYCGWWSSTGYSPGYAWSLVLIYSSSEATLCENGNLLGLSVRCVKDN
jgi:uncharacterized protein (TIGR02145 family)